MAKYSSSAVISFFAGEDNGEMQHLYFSGSDDELGMEDAEECNSEPEFEPLEVPEGNYIYTHG